MLIDCIMNTSASIFLVERPKDKAEPCTMMKERPGREKEAERSRKECSLIRKSQVDVRHCL